MGKITMLTLSNIRKSKSQALNLLIFILIAAMFLNIGLVLYFDFGKFFNERAEQLHAPHAAFLQSQAITTEEQIEWTKQYPNISEIEKQTVLSGYGDYYLNDAKSIAVLIFANIDDSQHMNPPMLIGKSLPLDDNSIYVPYLMKATGGYELGDDYRISLDGKEYHFSIAGFTEEILYGAMANQLYRFYLSNDAYETLSRSLPYLNCSLLSVRMQDRELGSQFQLDYARKFFYSQNASSEYYIHSVNINGVKNARTFFPLIIAMVLTAFSIVLLLVSLIIIRFRITNSIDESMTNIGVLKAAGFKNNQIISSIMLQFGSISIIGGLFGITASQGLLPVLTRILESQSSLIWNPGFNFILAAITVCLIMLSVLLVSFASAKNIYRLHPLIALRGGIQTHNFKKNRIPLDQSRGRLTFLLGMKRLVQNKKQALMIMFIIAAMSFTSIIGITIYYNLTKNMYGFSSILAGEVPDAVFMLKDSKASEDLIKKLEDHNEVRKAIGYQGVSLLINDLSVYTNVTKDFSLLEGNMLYEGRYPKHSNEVAIGGRFAEITGVTIGDTILIVQGGKEREFLITGLIQAVNNEGINMTMTYDGLLSLQDEFAFEVLYVYLSENTDVAAFIEKIKAIEGDIFINTTDFRELADAMFGSYGSIFAAVATGILLITTLIIVLTLYMVIKTVILRSRREIGIQKAMGFTTFQLMNQFTLSYMPTILVGMILGGAAGYVGFNPLFAALTRSLGIIKTDLPAPLDWTIVTCSALTVVSYLASMLMVRRIRKISAYSLISE